MAETGVHNQTGLPDELRARKVELVLQQLESLPTLPAIAVRLLSLTNSSNAKIEEVAELISADPALTSKLLSLVGSAGMGVRQPVTSVKQAVVMVGFEALRNLVLSIKVFEAFREGEGTSGGFDRGEFWKHSLAVATAAEALAPKCKPALSPHDAFVCGLLHDLGKVAFDAVVPKSFARVLEVANLTRGDIADAERRIIGLDHGVAGKRLAEAWNLPAVITQTIWLHGGAPMAVPAGMLNPGMVQLIGLADFITRRQHIGFSGNYLFSFDLRQYMVPLGLAEADVTAVTERLAEELEKRARALGLYDVQSRQLYLQSIANANVELGRVNQVLAGQNRALAQRSDCFELLTKFYQRVVPTATPGQLLAEIGQVAHQFFNAEQLVLFSQDPDQKVGEVLLFDSRMKTHDSFLMQMPAFGGDMRLGRATNDFVRPASPQLDWLLERVNTMVGERGWSFMPLLSGTQPIGGVLWPEGENTRAVKGLADLVLVSESWGVTLRTAQVREQHNVLTEALAGSNRELGALQQQLIRAKSLASLGEMAAGAAHEMNNPLAVVCGRAQLLASKLSDSALKQDAEQIAQQGARLSDIITDLMAFAKPTAPKMAACSMVEVAEEAIAEVRQRMGASASHVQVSLENHGELPAAYVDGRQICSALVEVILNAVQASGAGAVEGGKGGEVVVQVRYDSLDEQFILQVTDRGIGMSDDIMRQAFAPFYSAKTAGRQRGMGLAKAMRWMEMHGGTIRLDSAPHVGTTAVMILPVGGVGGVAGAVEMPA